MYLVTIKVRVSKCWKPFLLPFNQIDKGNNLINCVSVFAEAILFVDGSTETVNLLFGTKDDAKVMPLYDKGSLGSLELGLGI